MANATRLMDRSQHDKVVDKAIEFDPVLFSPPTLESIARIENTLAELKSKTGRDYVAVFVGQPFGGPKHPMAIPKDDVEAAHRAYSDKLRGISPEIGRVYDLFSERQRLEEDRPRFNLSAYPKQFQDFLRKYWDK